MKKLHLDIPVLNNRKHNAKLRIGICDTVATQLTLAVGSLVNLKDADIGRTVDSLTEVFSQFATYFTPKNWCQVDHYAIVVECEDGRVLLDIPMKEYARRDIAKHFEDIGHKAFWYNNGNSNYHVCMIRSARDIMEAYQCSWEDAKRIAHQVADNKDSVNYTVDLTVDELYLALS